MMNMRRTATNEAAAGREEAEAAAEAFAEEAEVE